MSFSDPIADMLTRIRNAVISGQTITAMPHSKVKVEIAKILKDEGYSVKAVYNGSIGKKQLDNENFDILLLDIKIPGLNGFEILHALKQLGKAIKIIVLTGRPVNETITQFENRLDEEEI